jgi:hypothetical protein
MSPSFSDDGDHVPIGHLAVMPDGGILVPQLDPEKQESSSNQTRFLSLWQEGTKMHDRVNL